jgi:hypothetical protein
MSKKNFLQKTPPAIQPRAYCADRDGEQLRYFLVAVSLLVH